MALTTLGKYKLHEKLGEGATADVYRAVDSTLGREVALKILKPGLVADPSSFARFVQEARSAAGLFHTNIVTVLETGEEDGRYFIAMRYVPGRSLDKLIRERPLTPEETGELAKQMGQALDYAHKASFLHRDVKPSNIIATEDGQYVLTDFGLVRALMTAGLTSHTGAALGTPSYIAPEIWLNQPATQATDQYALACVLYEALTGEVLFAGDTPPAILARHMMSEDRLPKSSAAEISAAAREVLGRALQKDPSKRFSSVGEFSHEFTSSIASGSRASATRERKKPVAKALPKAETPSTAPAKPKPLRPMKSADMPWAVIAAAVVVVVAILFVLGRSVPAVLRRAPTPGAPANPPAASSPNATPVTTILATPEPPVTSSPALPIGSKWTRPADGMTMMYVPEGIFEMGSPEGKGDADENPQHAVYLSAFWIDLTEVTNKMYALCVQANACKQPSSLYSSTHASYYGNPQYDNYPVAYVDWDQANSYCGWAGGRLPTEAEWEKAARGTDGRTYPWGEALDCSFTNYAPCKRDTTAVGSYDKGRSPYGMYDMAGNVSEWVADWYDHNYYAYSPSRDPQGPDAGQSRVVRGGSWYSSAGNLRAGVRHFYVPTGTMVDVGFRCAKPAP